MSLSDISGIVTSWADGYKNSTPNFNFGIQMYTLESILNLKFQFQA